MVRPRHRKINETFETEASRQTSFDCRLDDIRRKESERQGHPDRTLSLALSRSQRLQSLARIGQKFVEPAMGVAKSFDQDRARVGAHRAGVRLPSLAPWMISRLRKGEGGVQGSCQSPRARFRLRDLRQLNLDRRAADHDAINQVANVDLRGSGV